MEVRVTIGVYNDLKGVRIYKMNLPNIPQRGDTIILTEELKKEEWRMKEEWGLKFDERLNYVKAITYDGSSTPIVMLSASPDLIFVDCYNEGNGFLFSMYNRVVPRVGESVMDAEGRKYYVKDIIYLSGSITLYLADKAPVQDVYVVNNTLDVNVNNRYPVDVNISDASCELDVRVNDRFPINVRVSER